MSKPHSDRLGMKETLRTVIDAINNLSFRGSTFVLVCVIGVLAVTEKRLLKERPPAAKGKFSVVVETPSIRLKNSSPSAPPTPPLKL